MATVGNLAISLLRLAGAPFIAPAIRQAEWNGRATVSRLLCANLTTVGVELGRGRGVSWERLSVGAVPGSATREGESESA
jgi:hypothetical protein